jgi:hypothetical protein
VHRRTMLPRAADDRIPPALETVSGNDEARLQHISNPQVSVPVLHPAPAFERPEYNTLDFRKALEHTEPLFHRCIFWRRAHDRWYDGIPAPASNSFGYDRKLRQRSKKIGNETTIGEHRIILRSNVRRTTQERSRIARSCISTAPVRGFMFRRIHPCVRSQSLPPPYSLPR